MKKQTTAEIVRKTKKTSQAARDAMKRFNSMKKAILKSLDDGPKTIKQIAEITGKDASEVLFYLMSLQKFGYVTVDTIDDMDEYYLYKKTNKKK